jgi:CelD/BcsL family acetyltransferase involved in cellulose biosynthesis
LQGGWVEPAPGRAAPDRTTSIPDDPRRSGEDRASAGALVVTQYDRTEDFEGLRKEWNDLLERSRSQSVFLTWEWLYAWWRHFGAGFDLRIVAVRREGRLVGIGPFCVSPTWRWMPLRVLTFLGTTRVSSEYLDIVADPSCEQEVVDAIFRTFREDGGRWDCMVLPEVLAESLVLSHLEGRARSAGSRVQRTLSQVCPYLNLPKSDVEFFALLGPQMRAALRRSTRKLEGVGAEVKRIDLVDGDPSVLSVLFSLHEKRWAVRNRAGNFKDQTIRAFHGQLVKDLGAAGWLCLYVLQMEGRPIGVLYGFRFKDKFFFYQSGFDPQPPTSAIKWADYSPGLVLIGHGIREAIVQGLTEFDYLRGVEPYKRRWTKTDRTTWCLTVVPTGNWKARLLLRIQDTVTQTKTIVRAAVGKRKRDSAGSMKGKSV